MNKIFKQIKGSFAVFSALFITVITSKVRGEQDCGPEQLIECAKPLSVITDSGLTFASNKSDFDRMCPDLKHAIRCIHHYTRHCMNFEEQTHFKKLFRGTGYMVSELCKNGTYQKEYLKYAPCMKKVEQQNEVCFKKFTETMKDIEQRTKEKENDVSNVLNGINDINQMEKQQSNLISYQKRKREAADEGIKSVCCSFQQYVECTTHSVERSCGVDAARFSRDFLDRMSLPLIQLHCTEYGKRECGLMSSSNSINLSLLMFSILSILTYFIR